MIVSPPFLPARQSGETEDQFIDRCMHGSDPDDGGYPVSFQLNWHGGIHLTAPLGADGAALHARAIADGTVAFVRTPTIQNSDAGHPLNYRGGWTDDGCVVIRHETEIGVNAQTKAPTKVVFFSIYMHLRSLSPEIQQGHRIFRKQEVGTAGRIYGAPNRIHFEVICDDAEVARLTGRTDRFLTTDVNGRADAVFGAMFFALPEGTKFLSDDPRHAGPPPSTSFTVSEPLVARMRFDQGNTHIQTLHPDGTGVGSELVENGDEYELFRAANRHYPKAPSAGYELLRFGRVLGPDRLDPVNAAHWRQLPHPTGTGWVNLNGAGITKFSDADFPDWDGWMLVDGTFSRESHLRAFTVAFLGVGWLPSAKQAEQTLKDPVTQKKLSKKIVKFQTEWDASTIDLRYGWLRTDKNARMTAPDFARFKAHVSALCFWQQAGLGIDGSHWRFHPREFIRHFRKCGWMTLDELTQLMPRQVGRTKGKTSLLPWADARKRLQPYSIDINLMFRKYNLLDARRQVHFLAQVYIETGVWLTSSAMQKQGQQMREFGRGRPRPDGTWDVAAKEYYNVFYGRGAMQTTWAGNSAAYGDFRKFPPLPDGETYRDPRITHTSLHYWSDPRDKSGHVVDKPRRWFPRFDPEIIADDPFATCDSGGYYWVSKDVGHGQLSINRVADRDITPPSVGRVSVLVNGGGYGFAERQSYAKFIERFRDDGTSLDPTLEFEATHGKQHHHIFVDLTPQRP